MSDIQTYQLSSSETGPHVVIFGGVHGNEPCGTQAIEQLIDHVQSDQLNLKSGRLTVIPKCNPKACEQKTRFINVNLNRIIHPHFVKNTPETDNYEYGLLPELLDHIEQADVFIDIHSTTDNMPAFALSPDDFHGDHSLARASGFETIIINSRSMTPEESWTTHGYANECGARSILIECGQHNDPASVDRAYDAVIRMLAYVDVIDHAVDNDPTPRFFDIVQNVRRHGPGSFTKDWRSFQEIESGQALAHYDDGMVILAKDDGYIFMPNEQTPLGEEWLCIVKSLEGF